MSNQLEENVGSLMSEGREIHVINNRISVTIGVGTKIFEIALWTAIPLLYFLSSMSGHLSFEDTCIMMVLGTLPGIVFLFMKTNANAYLKQLEQKIQAAASEIDNYQEQRVIVLQNVAGLLQQSIALDQEVMTTVATVRSGVNNNVNHDRNQKSQQIDSSFLKLNIAFEAYPELRSHTTIADAMQQNSYLQKEVTAARTLYNDRVALWNNDIFAWPTKKIVAAKLGYTTRIPFVASSEIKSASKGNFF